MSIAGVGVSYTTADKTYGSATFFVKDGQLQVKFAQTTNGNTFQPLTVPLGQM